MVALLKLTKEKVWSLTDPKQYLLIDKAKREDICFAGKSHVRDNNLYCESISFAKKKPETFLPYLDANNLYGHAMSQLLPVGGFKWASQTTLEASSQDGKPLRWRCQGHVPRSRSQLFKTSPQKSPRFPSHTKKKNAHCVQTSPRSDLIANTKLRSPFPFSLTRRIMSYIDIIFSFSSTNASLHQPFIVSCVSERGPSWSRTSTSTQRWGNEPRTILRKKNSNS